MIQDFRYIITKSGKIIDLRYGCPEIKPSGLAHGIRNFGIYTGEKPIIDLKDVRTVGKSLFEVIDKGDLITCFMGRMYVCYEVIWDNEIKKIRLLDKNGKVHDLTEIKEDEIKQVYRRNKRKGLGENNEINVVWDFVNGNLVKVEDVRKPLAYSNYNYLSAEEKEYLIETLMNGRKYEINKNI